MGAFAKGFVAILQLKKRAARADDSEARNELPEHPS